MELIQPLDDDSLMPFGKFKGERMIDVPDWYLVSLRDSDFVEEQWPEVWDYIEDNWNILNSNH